MDFARRATADEWLDEGIQATNNRIGALLDEYLETVQTTTSSSNFRKESYHVENFIRPAIGHKKISSVTDQDFQDIINKAFRRKDSKIGETVELSKKSLSNIRATIMAFLKMCRKKKVSTLFLEDLSIPQGARLKGTKILQPNDLITLFSVDTTVLHGKTVFDEYVYAYRFAVLTGLRPGELRALTKKNVNGYQVQVRGSLNSYNEETKGKNENAVRGFVMSEMAKQTLDAQLATATGGITIFDIPSMSTFRHRWTKYCESNGIEPISLYALRHTFVSVVKTLPEGTVKPLVGHSRSMDTFGTYGHELAGEGSTTAQSVNDIFVKLLKSGL